MPNPASRIPRQQLLLCCAEVFNKYLFKEQTSMTPASVWWPMLEFQWELFIVQRTEHFISYVVVQSLSHVWLFATPWTAAHQASLSLTISQRLPKFMSTELVMLSSHLILCYPLSLLLSIFPSISVFFSALVVHIKCKVLELQLEHQSFQ